MKFDDLIGLYLEEYPTTIKYPNVTKTASVGNTRWSGTPSGFKGDFAKGNPNELLPNEVSSLFYQKKPQKKSKHKYKNDKF
jgi:hypothetical protein